MRLLNKKWAILNQTELQIGEPAVIAHYCDGCKQLHPIPVNQKSGLSWNWNNDIGKATLSPSIKITGGGICHYHIKNGNIEYGNDSTHHLKGQTVPLPDIPNDVTSFYEE